MKKNIIIFILALLICIVPAQVVIAKAYEIPVFNANKTNPEIILINQDLDVNKYNISELVDNGKLVYVYNQNNYIFDYYTNKISLDTYATAYYYDDESLFTIEKLVFSGSNDILKADDIIYLADHFDRISSDFLNSKVSLCDNSIIEKSALSTIDFTTPISRIKSTVIQSQKKGYFIVDTFLYRQFLNGFTLYRVDSSVQLTSGHSATSGEGFNSKYKAYRSDISGTLNRNIEYGYGTWASNQPFLLDYYPHTTPVYRTITSGIQIGLTLGRTEEATMSGGTNTGASATSTFLSEFNFQYFYQATSEFQSPLLSSGELSSGEGSFWKLFSWGPDRSVTVYPGALVEVVPANYNARYDGKYLLKVKFTVRKTTLYFFHDDVEFDYEAEIFLDNMLGEN